MDPLLIICTLLGFTFEYTRRVWRTYHPRREPARDFREFLPQRVSNWIDEVDWERNFGLRYDPWTPPSPAPITLPPPAEEIDAMEEAAVEVPDEPSDLELTLRLENEVVRAVTQTLFDEIGLIAVADEPAEELLPVDDVVVATEKFVAVDPLAGQPIGDPSVWSDQPVAPPVRVNAGKHRELPAMVEPAVHRPESSVTERSVSVDLMAGQPIGDPSVIGDLTIAARPVGAVVIEHVETPDPVEPASDRLESFVPERSVSVDFRAGQPVGDPSVIGDDPIAPPVRVIAIDHWETPAPVEPAIIRPRFVPRVVPFQSFGPVGAPGVFDDESIPRSSGITAVDFGEEPYRVAASARRSDDYAIAAYTLNSGDDKAPAGDAGAGEEEPPLDPVDEIIAGLLEEDPPAEDPNTLELPLEIPAPPDPFAYCEPVGGPDVFECTLPAAGSGDADVRELEDEPSAPTTRQVNRLSERVETILSNALARPAPAVNFGDLLAQMDARKQERKKKQEEAANRLPSQALEDNIERSADRDGGLKMTEYKVQFEIFEGPLDLLLYLVRKQEVDIYEVNLTQIAEEFIKYIELMRRFDLEVAGEFLVMASTLMYIKSKELLPVEQQAQVEEEDDDQDPRWELIRQLVEYKKFKDAATDFRQLELAQEDVFPRNPPKPDFPVQKLKGNVSVFDLLGAVNRILERIDAREEREIVADRWTVSEKIEQIHGEIQKRERFKFSELFEDALSRSEVVATFLALLELIKLKVIVVEQPDPYADIDICKAPPDHKLNLDEEEELPLEEAAALPASEFDAPAGEQE